MSIQTILFQLAELRSTLRTNTLSALLEDSEQIQAGISEEHGNCTTDTQRSELRVAEMELLRLQTLLLCSAKDFTRCRVLHQKLDELICQSGSALYKAHSEFLTARLALAEANHSEAETHYRTALESFLQLEEWYMAACALNALGNLHYHHSQRYDIALALYHQLEELCFNHAEANEVLSSAYMGMHNIYVRLDEHEKTLSYLDKARNVVTMKNDFHSRIVLHINYASHFRRVGNSDEQIVHLLEAQHLQQESGLFAHSSSVSLSLATAFTEQKRFDEAVAALDAAMEQASQARKFEQVAHAHLLRAELYANNETPDYNLELAEHHFNKALEVAKSSSLLHMQSAILSQMGDAFKRSAQWQKSTLVLEEALQLQMKVFNEDRRKQIAEIESQYNGRLKDREAHILRLEHEQLLQQTQHLENQLTMKTQAMLEQMKAIQTLRNSILESTKQLDTAEGILRQVRSILNESPVMRQDWDSFLQTFAQVHPTFSTELLSRYSNLSKMEIRICILIRANLSSEQIADLLALSIRNIENHRYRIRKKMQLQRTDTIEAALNF